jgi:two-component system CheB/CheR fusion protein
MTDEATDGAHARDAGLEALLGDVKANRGVDLSGYKRTTLSRRVLRRMAAVGVDGDFEAYRSLLRQQPKELTALFDSVFVNVTSFFRDPEAWDYLAQEIIPRILNRRGSGEPIRVWSAGCASGEEPFTIAMVLAEALGTDELARRVKIYATDWDEAALQQARQARYPTGLAGVPEPLRDKYFRMEEDSAVLDGVLRRAVIFGKHDLVEDAPISRVHLLVCRNTLMYFTAETQARILRRLHFALADDGYLFLGRAEMLLSHTDLFAPVELKHRIFAPQAGRIVRSPAEVAAILAPRRRDDELSRNMRMRDAALESSPVGQIVINAEGRIAVINSRAAMFFQLGPPDVGRPLQDLELSYRPVDLRSMIDHSIADNRPIHKKNVEFRPVGREVQFLDITVTPVIRDGALQATTLTFADVTHHHQLQENLQRFSENLETAYEELQSANEELETTNEELQSANEELETTNEELQAANEEMETVNEELRSTNDELQVTNDRLRQQDRALAQTNEFLNIILRSLRVGVAVVGSDFVVRVWNEVAVDLFGVRHDEAVGRPLVDLDIGLPVAELVEPIRECLLVAEGGKATPEMIFTALNRRGREFQCRVVITPFSSPGGTVARGACILMEDRGT